jgi:hypothetical protein
VGSLILISTEHFSLIIILELIENGLTMMLIIIMNTTGKMDITSPIQTGTLVNQKVVVTACKVMYP